MTIAAALLPFPIVGERVAIEAADAPLSASIRRLADDLVAGHAEFTVDGETLHIANLLVDEPYRGYGAGTEAARLIIDAAPAAGFRRITAWAPPDRGLATYFWYRMGLRALHGPGPNGGILFERLLATTEIGRPGGGANGAR